jgi:DNA-binding transcriptional ArsR family regulator
LTSKNRRYTFNAVVNNENKVTAVFAALSDPTRRRIVQRLIGEGEIRVTGLAKPFRISLPAISRHLRVLEKARLITRRRSGREHYIRRRAEGLDDARKWIMQYAQAWDGAFDVLDQMLEMEKKKEKIR